LEVPPIAPYTDFFIPNSESGASMWRKYEINEKGLRSEFINMEKIKITHSIVLKNINVLKLIQQGMATAYFPIHDPYQLRGMSKEPFFKTLHDASLMNE
jgi:anoctamin-10